MCGKGVSSRDGYVASTPGRPGDHIECDVNLASELKKSAIVVNPASTSHVKHETGADERPRKGMIDEVRTAALRQGLPLEEPER
ncbi:hypothetical protein FB566_0033 [Stackebrandtia endophytica]|uniref:Uncharacterized protein n=1 Tax=Stackebrandtia endophytica TaxID=1496996 RepID=A0A543APP7_9ACTN|nr:hypothetical protein FB566_0033 [Stackebrandtia endophytica]